MENEVLEVRTISTRSLEVVELEVASLKKLIDERNTWLADKDNRRKSTYDETKKDTLNMIWKYKELVDELNELKNQ